MAMALNTRQEFFDPLVAVFSSADGPVKVLITIKKCMPCCLNEITGWSIDLDWFIDTVDRLDLQAYEINQYLVAQ